MAKVIPMYEDFTVSQVLAEATKEIDELENIVIIAFGPDGTELHTSTTQIDKLAVAAKIIDALIMEELCAPQEN
jgi:hypothetical protein